ncbi:hypothetical protein AJ80_05361 [Polytolypa hystricis UAMH7299]|uniref:Zn(2)-C6 fungal-type domain-containing protein n=1 Tax=Polytolypa hystricis (strain UAMH7299) TaxID=1447883 RepID=A0A2B7Y446_POLH7|nr:hypothetical protein AJ80_05361 [Polytolypa hystricis UAMH7299]
MPASAAAEDRKRKRTSLACDTCRVRKVRCDGRDPCLTCSSAGEECTYGLETSPKSKTDIVLDVALRSERLLREMSARLVQNDQPVNIVSSPVAVISPAPTDSTRRQFEIEHNISNAILSPFHASTTESILAWPHFDHLQSLRQDYSFSVFNLENSRPSFPQLPSAIQPYASRSDIERTIQNFSQNVNFWYPTMTRTKLRASQQIMTSGRLDDSESSCLALLVMALGSASALVASVAEYDDPVPEETENRSQWKVMSELYFDSALKKLHVAQMECTIDSVQCLFFAGLFFAFLQRPVQAWSFLSSAATKCRLLLLSQGSNIGLEDYECLRRIFWSCYILESDYLAELSALPQSGISDIESSIPLPGEFDTHDSPLDKEKSSLYFLACISIRRLLNRVHNLLYAKDTGASFDDAQFPSVVSELDHQLEQWRELLPPDFQFDASWSPAQSPQGGFLRQRYLTCRSVIYRPYLNWALSNSADIDGLPEDVYENCKRCLQACWMHGLNLKSFAHTVMVDTWICSLSMASAMLILLAASQITALQNCIRPISPVIGPHLEGLLRSWMHLPGQSGVSPSVKRSIELIGEVSQSLKEIIGD